MYRLKVIFILILTILLFTSCTNQESLVNEENKVTEGIIDSTQDKTLDFRINDEERGLIITDFDQVYLLCKSFLKDAYNTYLIGEAIDLDAYISNNNLKEYVHKKIENRIKSDPFKSIDFGIYQIDWNSEKEFVFVDIVMEAKNVDVGGFSEMHQFLISNEDGMLHISDWYSPPKSGHIGVLDELSRDYTQKISDPNIWDNQEWVDGVFEKVNNIR